MSANSNANKLAGLTVTGSPSNGQIPFVNSSTLVWEDGLAVDLTSVTTNDTILFDGSKFVNDNILDAVQTASAADILWLGTDSKTTDSLRVQGDTGYIAFGGSNGRTFSAYNNNGDLSHFDAICLSMYIQGSVTANQGLEVGLYNEGDLKAYGAGSTTLFFTDYSANNVGIGTPTPHASSILDVVSTTKAFYPPRMTKTQRNAITSPQAGAVVYQTDNTPGIRVYNGSNWMRFTETTDA